MRNTALTESSIKALRDHLVGKEVAVLQVYGINSLKTLSPALTELAGQIIDQVNAAASADRRLELTCASYLITIDLARTGVAVVLTATQPWIPSGRTSPPTGRLVLTDGTGVDFKEPGRTKRITFSVNRQA